MADPGTPATVRGRPRDGEAEDTRRQELVRSVPAAEPGEEEPAAVARRIVEEVLREHREVRRADRRGSSPDAAAVPTRPRPAARPPEDEAAPTGRVEPDDASASRVVAEGPTRTPRRPERWLVVLAIGLLTYVVTLVLGLGALGGVLEGRLSDEAPAPAEPAAEPAGDLPLLPREPG